jgi:hypothetical protein
MATSPDTTPDIASAGGMSACDVAELNEFRRADRARLAAKLEQQDAVIAGLKSDVDALKSKVLELTPKAKADHDGAKDPQDAADAKPAEPPPPPPRKKIFL